MTEDYDYRDRIDDSWLFCPSCSEALGAPQNHLMTYLSSGGGICRCDSCSGDFSFLEVMRRFLEGATTAKEVLRIVSARRRDFSISLVPRRETVLSLADYGLDETALILDLDSDPPSGIRCYMKPDR